MFDLADVPEGGEFRIQQIKRASVVAASRSKASFSFAELRGADTELSLPSGRISLAADE